MKTTVPQCTLVRYNHWGLPSVMHFHRTTQSVSCVYFSCVSGRVEDQGAQKGTENKNKNLRGKVLMSDVNPVFSPRSLEIQCILCAEM